MTRLLLLGVLLAAPATVSAQARTPASPDLSGGGRPAALHAPLHHPDAATAAATITADDLRRGIGVIAHDSMRGRDTPSPELDEVAEWLGAELRRYGLQPGGDAGSFVQRYPIRQVATDFGASELVSADGVVLHFGTEVGAPFGVVPERESTAGVVLVSGSANAARALEGADLRGKHVVLVPGAGVEMGRTRATIDLMRGVLSAGPAAVLVATDRADAVWNRGVRGQREQVETVLGVNDGPLVVEVRDQALTRLLEPRGVRLAALRARQDEPVSVTAVEGLELTARPKVRILQDGSGPNVVGILEGSDPVLKDEYVVYSAHMDHVGVGRPDQSGDAIYNGADDDASGTIAVLEVAQALASLEKRPRRSVLFVLVSGEEKGLWGSSWFMEHPPVPKEKIVANLNVDMVGRNWTDTIVAIGREHSDLGATLARVDEAHPELGLAAIDDQWPAENFYMRSDHYNFARKGVPILFFFSGTHEDYHRPSDELEGIDAEKTARIGRLLFHLGLEVASAPDAPVWNPESYRRIVGGGR